MTKKAFISVVSSKMVQRLETLDAKTSYETLRNRLKRKNMDVRFYVCRKWFSTTLRDGGVESEIVDLLQGRLPRTIFLRHYYRPQLEMYFEKVRKVLNIWEEKWL